MYGYASLEASRRLVEAGIVLETETVWARYGTSKKWNIELLSDYLLRDDYECILAPSMAEVWREFCDNYPDFEVRLEFEDGITVASCGNFESSYEENYNPTDALIDLLIWVRKEADHG